MIYKFVCVVIVLNLLYELIEVVFPAKKMKGIVKSFVMMLMVYALCDYISKML